MRLCRFLFLLFIVLSVALKAQAAIHLSFTPEFIDAVARCSPFEENISASNPDYAAYLSPELAKVKIKFLVNILGKTDSNLCDISFHQSIEKMGDSIAFCNISDEQREALLYALKDTSDEQYSDTFALAKSEDETTEDPQITIEGSLLHVVYHKILNTSCHFKTLSLPDTTKENGMSDITPDENLSAVPGHEKVELMKNGDEQEKSTDKVEQFVQYEVFAPDFMKSWQLCRSDVTEQDLDGKIRKLEIIGVQNGRCQVKFGKFDLNIPQALMANIHSFVDVEALLKNGDIAHYSFEPEYVYDGLIYALDACLQKKGYDGDEETLVDDNVTIRRGMFSEYINRQCVFHLQNELEIGGRMTDYSVLCSLNDKAVQELQPYFKEMVEMYGRKRMFTHEGKVEIHKAEFNEETHKGDIALMFYLQQNGFCKHNP